MPRARRASRIASVVVPASPASSRSPNPARLTVASSWTNREILARLRFRSAVSRELAAFRDRVETASYSGAALSLNDFQECDTTLEHLTLHLEAKAP